MASERTAIKISKRTVDAAQAAAFRYVLWDADLKGFGLRVEPSGVKSFIARYRPGARGRTAPKRFMTIGRYGVLTPDDARRRAKEILGRRRMARTRPMPSQRSGRQPVSATLPRRSWRITSEKKRKPKTIESYEHVVSRYIISEFGTRKAKSLRRADLSRLHGKLSDKPAMANRLLAVASSMFSWRAAHGYVPEAFNPAARIEKFRETQRERYLSTDELERLGEALREAETIGLTWEPDARKKKAKHAPKAENRRVKLSEGAVAAIRLLLLTGARLREILHLRWEHVDLERGLLLLPDSKTGRKTIILNAPALLIVDGLDSASPFVIPGESPEKPRSDLKRPWAAISTRAGLTDVRLHDLRHTHASFGAGAGMGLPIIGKLLGHAQSATTARYAHLDADPLRKASNRIGGAISAALDGKGAEVVPIERERKAL